MPLKGLDDVRIAMAGLKKSANDDVRGVYIGGLQNMIMPTPTGFKFGGTTRNAWFLTTGAPSTATRLQARASGSASFNQIKNNMPVNVLNKTLYWTNTSPAINFLEYGGYPEVPKYGTYTGTKKSTGRKGYEILSEGGYSKQAPGGWIRGEVKRMRRKVREL